MAYENNPLVFYSRDDCTDAVRLPLVATAAATDPAWAAAVAAATADSGPVTGQTVRP